MIGRDWCQAPNLLSYQRGVSKQIPLFLNNTYSRAELWSWYALPQLPEGRKSLWYWRQKEL